MIKFIQFDPKCMSTQHFFCRNIAKLHFLQFVLFQALLDRVSSHTGHSCLCRHSRQERGARGAAHGAASTHFTWRTFRLHLCGFPSCDCWQSWLLWSTLLAHGRSKWHSPFSSIPCGVASWKGCLGSKGTCLIICITGSRSWFRSGTSHWCSKSCKLSFQSLKL